MGKIMLNEIDYSGGNANVIRLTQAEYDALPPSKLTDNNVYMITDVNGDGSQFQPVIYSEDEREIGVWTDGKPLYQKTFLGTVSGSSPEYTIDISNMDIESIVCSSLHSTSSTDTQTSLYYYSSSDFIRWYSNDGMTEIKINSNGDSSSYPKRPYDFRLTIQYTKTTDTAGSGTWTPQGVPAVHYSTDEKVVGTWIDGSTLYEKTIIASISEVNSHEYSDNDLNNSDMAMIIDGYYTLTDNFVKVPLNQWESSTYYTRTGFRNDKTIYLYVNGYSVTGNTYITVRYTKTPQGGN